MSALVDDRRPVRLTVSGHRLCRRHVVRVIVREPQLDTLALRRRSKCVVVHVVGQTSMAARILRGKVDVHVGQHVVCGILG